MNLSERTSSLLMFMLGLVILAFALSLFVLPVSAADISGPGYEPLQTDATGWAILGIAIGAGLAVGLAGVGGGIGMGTASAAALGAITEKPENFGKSILYVVLIEVIAIYGFVIAYLLMGYIPMVLGG